MLDNKRLRLITWIVGSAMFLEAIDASALNTSLKVIAGAFSINPIDLKLALTAYLLTLGVLMPLNSFLVVRVGEKRLFLFANVIFFLGSLGCGLSHGLIELISFRILQGIGGAFLVPIVRLTIVKNYPTDKLYKGFAIVAGIASLGLVLGPVIGGLISTYISWRFIFFINLPVIALVVMLSIIFLPKHQAETTPTPYDWLGFFGFGIALASTLFFLEVIMDDAIGGMIKVALLVSMVMFFSLYFYRALTAKYPLFPRELWFNKTFRFAIVGSWLWRLGITVPVFLVPLYLQLYHHFTAAHAGLFLLSAAIGTGCTKPLLGVIQQHIDIQKLVISMVILTTFILLGIAWLIQAGSLWLLLPVLFIQGLSYGLGASFVNMTMYGSLPREYFSQGTVLNGVVIQLSGSFAITLVALVIFISTGTNWLASPTIPLTGLHTALEVMSVFPLLALVAFYLQTKCRSKNNESNKT